MLITGTTAILQPVSQKIREEINQLPATESIHRKYMQLPCMNKIEILEAFQAKLTSRFRVVAWNLERCLFVEKSAQHIGKFSPDIVLLSEMDNGMARTAQKHTTKELAELLGMNYLYGVEFLELDLGSDTDQIYAKDKNNQLGFHGNALLSKTPIIKAAMLRFDNNGHWFMGQQVGDSFGQRRVGGRIAILAIVNNEQGCPICFVSTHLESNAGIEKRDEQIQRLLKVIDNFAGTEMPVIIGGDLNTGNNLPNGQDHNQETLFQTAEKKGYHWNANIDGYTTRPSLLTKRPERTMKLDWFCARGINSGYQQIISSLDEENIPLSDHDMILTDWQF